MVTGGDRWTGCSTEGPEAPSLARAPSAAASWALSPLMEDSRMGRTFVTPSVADVTRPHEHHCPGIGHGRRPRAAGREGHLQDPKRVPRAERLHGTEEGWEKRRSRKRGGDHGSRPVALVCTLAVYHIDANETRHIGRIGQILFQLPRFSLPSSVFPHRRKLLKTIIWYGALTFF